MWIYKKKKNRNKENVTTIEKGTVSLKSSFNELFSIAKTFFIEFPFLLFRLEKQKSKTAFK